MIKEDIVTAVGKETRYSRAMCETIIDSFLRNIVNALSNDEKVTLVGFGTFEPKRCAPRTGRNPHTNEAVHIPARIRPSFKAGDWMKSAVTKPLNK